MTISELNVIQELDHAFTRPRTAEHYGCKWWRDHLGLWKQWPDGRKEFVTARGRIRRRCGEQRNLSIMRQLGAAAARRLRATAWA